MKSKILIPCYLLLLFPFISWSQIGHTAYIFDNLGNNLSTAQTYCQSNFPGNTSIYSVPNEVLIEVGKIYEYTDGSNTVFYAVVGIKSTSPKFGFPLQRQCFIKPLASAMKTTCLPELTIKKKARP